MSSLTSTLRLSSYRESLSAAIRFAQEDRGSMLAALRYGLDAPKGVEPALWSSIVGATRFAYEAGHRDDRAEVISDIRGAFEKEFSEDELDSFLSLLAEDELVDARIEGTRLRDSLMPNLIGANVSLDLRVISPPAATPVAAPVVLARLDFDEHVAGQDAITFQIPLEALNAFVDDLDSVRRTLTQLPATLSLSLPDWARGTAASEEARSE